MIMLNSSSEVCTHYFISVGLCMAPGFQYVFLSNRTKPVGKVWKQWHHTSIIEKSRTIIFEHFDSANIPGCLQVQNNDLPQLLKKLKQRRSSSEAISSQCVVFPFVQVCCKRPSCDSLLLKIKDPVPSCWEPFFDNVINKRRG